MQKLSFAANVESNVSSFEEAALLGLNDVYQAILDQVDEPRLGDYFEAPVLDQTTGNLETEGEQFDLTYFAEIYDAIAGDSRPFGEHSLVVVQPDINWADEGTNFTFGSTTMDYRTSIVSAFRIVRLADNISVAEKTLRAISRHEMGHQFGLTGQLEEQTTSEHDPIHDHHCQDSDCTMQPIEGYSDLLKVAELEDDPFCDSCAQDLGSYALMRVATLNNL